MSLENWKNITFNFRLFEHSEFQCKEQKCNSTNQKCFPN